MAGIISNTLDNGQTTYGADTSKVDPSLQTVDSSTQTVAGQLHSILGSGSPYLEQARAGARDAANARGLINTSIAAGAGESAAINAALPIAQSDASTYNSVSAANQQAKNTASALNAGAENTANLNTAQAANTSELNTQQTQAQKELQQQAADIQTGQVIPAQTQAQSQLSAQSASQDVALQSLRGDQAQTLAQIESQYKQLMQANASASSFYGDITTQLATILNNPNTSSTQKQNAVDQVNGLLQTGLTVIGAISNLNLAGLLDFNGANPTPA